VTATGCLTGDSGKFADIDTPMNPATCIDTLVHTDDVRIAEFELAPDSVGEIHSHSYATEQCVCLHGQLQMVLNGEPGPSLSPGGKLVIPAGVEHQVINTGSEPGRYLVIQYGGTYDFIAK
jgi:mannose-6-phosphate isomerase-like protein (cupin superfamily)